MHDADVGAIDRCVIGVRGAAEGHRVDARNQTCGGGDRIDRLFTLGDVTRDAGELDHPVEGARVQREAGQISRLPVDEVIGPDPGVDRRDGADAALQFADDVGQHDVTAKPNAALDQPLDRAERRRVAGLHVRHTDAVHEPVVVEAAPRVNGPALGHRVRVEVAVEQQALAAAGAAPDPDRIQAPRLDLLCERVETAPLHALDDELRKLTFPGRARVALEADHVSEKVERALGVVRAHGRRFSLL